MLSAGCQQPETAHSVSVAIRHVCGQSIDEFLNHVVGRHDHLLPQIYRQKLDFLVKEPLDMTSAGKARQATLGSSSNGITPLGKKIPPNAGRKILLSGLPRVERLLAANYSRYSNSSWMYR
jgi:hypothetical protein